MFYPLVTTEVTTGNVARNNIRVTTTNAGRKRTISINDQGFLTILPP